MVYAYMVLVLSILSFVLSFSIIGCGIELSNHAECDWFLATPVIVLGVCILVLSIVGLVGYFCKLTWLMWVYLVLMLLVLLALFGLTLFAFMVTIKGAGKAVPGRGYKEYRLGDYSEWLRDRVNSRWPKMRSCLVKNNICEKLRNEVDDNICGDLGYEGPTPALQFYRKEYLSPPESGCCKPPDNCNFAYVSPTNWTKNNTSSHNPDCEAWDNDPDTLCYGPCQSCKAGVLDNIKHYWTRMSILNAIVVILLFFIHCFGIYVFRDTPYDNYWKQFP